jgi:tetratricopeptide (TPR) repeat protein
MSDALARLANGSSEPKRSELYERSRRYAEQALDLDPNLAEAHASMGWLLRIYEWNWADSEAHLRRAIELAPNEAASYRRLAYLFVTLGRTSEALELSAKARHYDPLDRNHAWFLYCDRRFEESAEEYAANLKSSMSANAIRDSQMGMAMSYIEIGRLDEAIRLLRELGAETKDFFATNAIYTVALNRAGDSEGVARMLPLLEQKAAASPGRWVRLAYVYAELRNKEAAIRALKLGVETRDDRLMWLMTTPYFDFMRDDPEFKRILADMKLL